MQRARNGNNNNTSKNYVPPQVNAATLATLFVVSGCVYVIFHHNLAASFYDAVFVNEIQ